MNEPARPDPAIPEPSQPTLLGDPDRGGWESLSTGGIGDPGSNPRPENSTPEVPSPGRVEEPSVPTLPDVGQVPVNPDAPGAPQQPGPQLFNDNDLLIRTMTIAEWLERAGR
ncbi:hypothetical protein [Rhodococcus sp. NPDC055024]